jgi:peptidoglycan hydrolase CwlO-like protein
MKERIQFAYENGDADYIDALVSIKDYDNVINQSEYVSQVSGYDQKQLNDLLEIEKSISEYKATISDNLSEVASLKEEAEGEQGALQVIQDGKMATLKEYNLDIAATEYTIEQMNAIEAEQDAQIAAIVAAASARRAAAEQTVTRTVTVEVPVETPASTASSTVPWFSSSLASSASCSARFFDSESRSASTVLLSMYAGTTNTFSIPKNGSIPNTFFIRGSLSVSLQNVHTA